MQKLLLLIETESCFTNLKYLSVYSFKNDFIRMKSFYSCFSENILNIYKSLHTCFSSQKPVRSCSLPILHSGSGRFRHGFLQLMIHTIDPLGEGRKFYLVFQLHVNFNFEKHEIKLICFVVQYKTSTYSKVIF